MKKKTGFFVLLWISCMIPALAASPKLSLVLGTSISTVLSDADIIVEKITPLRGINAGCGVSIPIIRALSFETGVTFCRKGYESEIGLRSLQSLTSDGSIPTARLNYKFDYLEFPIAFCLKMGILDLLAGGFVAVPINNQSKQTLDLSLVIPEENGGAIATYTDESSANLEGIDFGFCLGFTLWFMKDAAIDVKVNYSLIDFSKTEFGGNPAMKNTSRDTNLTALVVLKYNLFDLE